MSHKLGNADWDTVRIFLAVSRSKSFRKASSEVGATAATVTRTIERLEDLLGFRLFYRDVDGVSLTTEGRRVIKSAEEVERTIYDLWRIAEGASGSQSGPIRLAVTEGLGTFWLMPPLAQYIEANKDVRVELQAAMKSVDVLRFEADISIQFQEPTNPDLIVRRLGNLFLTFFASEDYVRRNGMLRRFEDLTQHKVVEQETDQLNDYGLDDLFGPGSTDRMVRIKTNFSSAHYWAVAKGAGIGLLPNYARLIGGRVVYMPTGWSMRVPIYMACHPEISKSARHRKFMNWLVERFSGDIYPWFSSQFIQPPELESGKFTVDLSEYFDGFVPTQDLPRLSANMG